jgi:hypothetical protein
MDPDIFATNALLNLNTNMLGTNALSNVLSPGMFNESFIWASFFWGTIGGGYLLFARKQRSIPCFLGGVAMIAVSFFISSWFWMSITSIAIMVGVYVMMKQEG